MRIVSLPPSATEIAFALGLGDQILAVSHECDYPSEARSRQVAVHSVIDSDSLSSSEIDRIVREHSAQGLPIYKIDRGVLEDVRPDLILSQELCDVCAITSRDVMEAIAGLEPAPRVITLDPRSLNGVLEDIRTVGVATNTESEAASYVEGLRRRIEAVTSRVREATARPRTVCLEWLEPPMACGHWMPELVELAGGEELLGRKFEPTRRVSWEEVCQGRPEALVLTPCGFDVPRTLEELPLLTRLPGWGDLPAVREGQVYACNGHSYFSRSGPRLVEALELLAQMLHPELFRDPLDPECAVQVDVTALISSG